MFQMQAVRPVIILPNTPTTIAMPISWNEIKSRALTFSRTWADAANEDSQGKPFWIDFFEIFGITNKRAQCFEPLDRIQGANHDESAKHLLDSAIHVGD
jgi:hypothetical protein